MKKYIYVTIFTLFSLIIATLMHAAIELPVLNIITGNFDKYADGFLWQNWQLIHGVVSGLIWLSGLILGIVGGLHFWQVLYVEEKFGKPRI